MTHAKKNQRCRWNTVAKTKPTSTRSSPEASRRHQNPTRGSNSGGVVGSVEAGAGASGGAGAVGAAALGPLALAGDRLNRASKTAPRPNGATAPQTRNPSTGTV